MRTAFNYFRGGQVSYSKFMEMADAGKVTAVNLKEGGQADFRVMNDYGISYGKVNLAGPMEPFIEQMQKDGIDLSITYNDAN